jgi:hypothetical protein
MTNVQQKEFVPGPINALNAVQGAGGKAHGAHLEGEVSVSGFVGERDEGKIEGEANNDSKKNQGDS